MSAQLREGRHLLPMSTTLLDAVLAIENLAYEFPWSRGNFVDSLAAGYSARVLCNDAGEMLGYFIAMPGVDEMHLLNITVAPQHQRQGHARHMLGALERLCAQASAGQLWLEVRVSNHRAQAIYERHGFQLVGRRKAYYPAAGGQREDALVMSLNLAPTRQDGPHALD